jgi:hypothetical protein
MASYLFEGSGCTEPVRVERELDLTPPHDLPTLLGLRAQASELLRSDPHFASATRVEIRLATAAGEPITHVDRAHLVSERSPASERSGERPGGEVSAAAHAVIVAERGEWTPTRLLALFCREELRSGFRAAARQEQERCDWRAGFCAYAGENAYGPGIDGFDDGSTMWGELTASGWELIGDPGDRQFPYSFTLRWRPREREELEAAFTRAGGRGVDLAERLDQLLESPDGYWCIASYCEGDFGIALYDDEAAYRAGEQRAREQ